MINHEKIRLHEEKFRWANGIWDEFNLKVEGLRPRLCEPVCPECKDAKCFYSYKCVNQRT